MKKRQSGYVLIESLISMLIFFIGILGLIALQSNLRWHDLEARMRVQASMLGSELIGMVNADHNNASCYVLPVQGGMNPGCTSATATNFATTWASTVTSALPSS